MKKVSKKVRLMLIDRFFVSANELPFCIEFSHTEDKWKIFKLQSVNHTHEVGYKEQFNEVALFS